MQNKIIKKLYIYIYVYKTILLTLYYVTNNIILFSTNL